MKYYKIIKDNQFIGVVHSGYFVAQNRNNGKLSYANEETGQYVNYQGTLYRDYWMVAISTDKYDFVQADITEITEQEYNTIIEAISHDEEIIIDDEPEEEIIPTPDIQDPDTTVEAVRAHKINEMSKTCRLTIEAGFDIELHDELQHFSLTTQDQLNLMSLSTLAQTQDLIPYHADGETCIFYTSAEIQQIIKQATELKIYHTTYFNALKIYINALDTIEDIAAIEYGVSIPEEYKTDALRFLEV